ncbi:hypothetical protein FVE85_6532 [Porphyridium purpureum]|uniref:Uncharacterized protein n=1 Tax=Porphyridium purpureum TaxID=35688 RepID=A0A5J4Z8B8_PORPP|nr:hypothetical protein FVE85_6532 [Porphyridium purpureum]|eukprot:POR4680..scf295_1
MEGDACLLETLTELVGTKLDQRPWRASLQCGARLLEHSERLDKAHAKLARQLLAEALSCISQPQPPLDAAACASLCEVVTAAKWRDCSNELHVALVGSTWKALVSFAELVNPSGGESHTGLLACMMQVSAHNMHSLTAAFCQLVELDTVKHIRILRQQLVWTEAVARMWSLAMRSVASGRYRLGSFTHHMMISVVLVLRRLLVETVSELPPDQQDFMIKLACSGTRCVLSVAFTSCKDDAGRLSFCDSLSSIYVQPCEPSASWALALLLLELQGSVVGPSGPDAIMERQIVSCLYPDALRCILDALDHPLCMMHALRTGGGASRVCEDLTRAVRLVTPLFYYGCSSASLYEALYVFGYLLQSALENMHASELCRASSMDAVLSFTLCMSDKEKEFGVALIKDTIRLARAGQQAAEQRFLEHLCSLLTSRSPDRDVPCSACKELLGSTRGKVSTSRNASNACYEGMVCVARFVLRESTMQRAVGMAMHLVLANPECISHVLFALVQRLASLRSDACMIDADVDAIRDFFAALWSAVPSAPHEDTGKRLDSALGVLLMQACAQIMRHCPCKNPAFLFDAELRGHLAARLNELGLLMHSGEEGERYRATVLVRCGSMPRTSLAQGEEFNNRHQVLNREDIELLHHALLQGVLR